MLNALQRAIRPLALAGAAAFAAGPLAQAGELEGVQLPDSATVAGQALTLNGMGLRTRAFFKVYVAGLYVPARSTDGTALMTQAGAKRVVFALKRDVAAETFSKALNDGIRDRSTPEQLAALQARMDRFDEAILSIKEVKEHDQVFLDFVPSVGTSIIHNGKAVGEPISGDDFFRAILNLFVGPKPVQDSLKEGLVGAK